MFDYASAKRSDVQRFARFFHTLLQEGVYLPPSQFEAAFVSLAMGEAEVEHPPLDIHPRHDDANTVPEAVALLRSLPEEGVVLLVMAGVWMWTRPARVQESRGPRWEYCSVGPGLGAEKNRAVSRVAYFSTTTVRRPRASGSSSRRSDRRVARPAEAGSAILDRAPGQHREGLGLGDLRRAQARAQMCAGVRGGRA